MRGRRVGKPLSGYQRELMGVLLPRVSIDLSRPLDPATLFDRPLADLHLEIGFGGGEHLLAVAGHHPEIGFIGCEPFVNGMARALADLATADLVNIRLHCGDAGGVVDALPDACLGRVYLFYPDPWPKRRQQKRRFVSDEILGRLARAMRPGAELRFATDIDAYCGWTLARLLRSPISAGPRPERRTGSDRGRAGCTPATRRRPSRKGGAAATSPRRGAEARRDGRERKSPPPPQS